MNILIDLGHPAHVHLFRNFALEMIKKNHNVLCTCRNKEFEINLLEHYNLPYIFLGKKYNSKIGKIWNLLEFDLKEIAIAKRFKPDVFLSHGSHYAAHASFVLRKPHISFEDTFNFEQIWLYKSFTDTILTSDYDHPLKSKKLIQYSGYHELAYLHPNWFNSDNSILKELGVAEGEKYVIMRFVSWKASHDIGHKGMSNENKLFAVKELEKHGKVFISSESELPKELESYRITLAPHKIHHAMAHASLVFGESATMVAEGAVLGVPGIYLDNTGRLYTKEMEEKYDMVYNFTESEKDQKNSILKAVEILKNDETVWKVRHQKMISEKIDVTNLLVWFVENYPKSYDKMKQDPDYQHKFK